MLCSLPMYDWPEVYEPTNELWLAIKECLNQHQIDAPLELRRDLDSPGLWTSGDCLFSQTCGWPLKQKYKDSLSIIAAPIYNLEGCDGFMNSSRVVCRETDKRSSLKDFHGSVVAINAEDSQSGLQALKSTLTRDALPAPFFAKQIISNAHRYSLSAVAAGQADIASIDPVSWALAQRHDPATAQQLRVIATGPYTPGLPFVCSKNLASSITPGLRESLATLFNTGLTTSIQDSLMLHGLVFPTMQDYEVLQTLDAQASNAGHQQLC